MRPICVPCQRFFRPEKNGYYFIEGMPRENDAQPGTAEPEKWADYKVWASDRYKCEGCGTVILSGFGARAIAEHYQPDFADQVERYNASQFRVNDCC